MSVALFAYSELMTRVERRSDQDTFMAGKGFAGFCEYWMAFAKKVGRLWNDCKLLLTSTPGWRYTCVGSNFEFDGWFRRRFIFL
jgi:hypothetical protein